MIKRISFLILDLSKNVRTLSHSLKKETIGDPHIVWWYISLGSIIHTIWGPPASIISKSFTKGVPKFSNVWTCNISVKKKSSDYCFAKLRMGKPFPNHWDIIKKWGFCVGDNDGVIDINHRNFWYYYWNFFQFSASMSWR